MSDETPKSEQPAVWRIRYSIATLLLLMAAIGLAIALTLTYRKLARTERELDAMRPLPEQEVARQFEKKTTLGPVRTTVTDVRYAPKEDAYKVSFSYVISGGPTASPTEWTSSVTLPSYGLKPELDGVARPWLRTSHGERLQDRRISWNYVRFGNEKGPAMCAAFSPQAEYNHGLCLQLLGEFPTQELD